ncbi:MAG: phosphonoacetaldehyde reductase [Eubacteriales bacterium]
MISSQIVIDRPKGYEKIEDFLQKRKVKNLLVVTGKSSKFDEFEDFLSNLKCHTHYFHGFSSNPTTEEVKLGIEFFHEQQCDGILAVGGGSAMDVGKSIKLFFAEKRPLKFDMNPNYVGKIPLICVPTTAGTGSEATDFVVVYHNKVKLSLVHPDILPDFVVLEPEFLKSLPLYQKKSAMMDALCQGIESFWSISATQESKSLVREGIPLILNHYQEYLENGEEGRKNLLYGSHLMGKAIKITKTTAPHAMSYGITSRFSLPHGHAVSLCLVEVWEDLLQAETTRHEQGLPYLKETLSELSSIFGVETNEKGVEIFEKLRLELGLDFSETATNEDICKLCQTVNVERLSNHPVQLSEKKLEKLYRKILNCEEKSQ